MPVSDERLAQIRELSNDERVDGMDCAGFTDADWERFTTEHEAEISAFCRDNRDPEELHAFAGTWNWDKGTEALEDILDNPACEAATALMIYWRAQPEYYLKYSDRKKVEDDGADLELFDFIAKLEARYLAGDFKPGLVTYNPNDPDEYCVGYYGKTATHVRVLPADMYIAVRPHPGENP